MPSHMDIIMQNVEKMRMQDPVRFNKLVQEGMAIELGIISPVSKKTKEALLDAIGRREESRKGLRQGGEA